MILQFTHQGPHKPRKEIVFIVYILGAPQSKSEMDMPFKQSKMSHRVHLTAIVCSQLDICAHNKFKNGLSNVHNTRVTFGGIIHVTEHLYYISYTTQYFLHNTFCCVGIILVRFSWGFIQVRDITPIFQLFFVTYTHKRVIQEMLNITTNHHHILIIGRL